jgi:hypothetical protein
VDAGGDERAAAARDEAALLLPAGGGAPAPAVPPAGSPGEDRDDARLLPFVLLHRSRMHAVDLRRALDALRGDDGMLALRRGEVRTRTAYRLDVMVQVAVELVLAGKEVQDRLSSEPEFRRLVHDAVYYASRRWAGEAPLDLTDVEGRTLFEQHILWRMDDSAPAPGGVPAAALSDADVDFLYDQARAVAQLLSDRGELRRRFKAEWRGYTADADENDATAALLHGTMGLDGQVDPPLIRTEPGRYRWRYDRSGRTLPLPPGLEAPDPEGDPEPEARFVNAFRRVLAGLVQGEGPPAGRDRVDLATLASEFHVLPPSPAWSEVELVVTVLLHPDGAGATERRAVGPIVRQFADLLRERAEALALALLAGAAVGQAAARGTPAERLATGLRVMSDAHRFAGLGPAQLSTTLRGVHEGLRRAVPLGAAGPLPKLTDDRSVAAWGHALEQRLEGVRAQQPDLAALRRDAEASTRKRVSEFLVAGTRVEPRVEELLVVARGEATAPVKLNLADMTLRDWSGLAYAALVGGGSNPWLGLAALAALGFRPGSWSEFATWLQGVKLFPGARQRRVEVDGLPQGALPAGARAAVVVRRASGSLTDAWMPDPAIPSLALTVGQAKTLLQNLKGVELPPLNPPLAVVAFEMPLDEDNADGGLLKLFNPRVAEGSWDRRVVYLYPDRPTKQARTPYVPAPQGLRDLLPQPAPPVAP